MAHIYTELPAIPVPEGCYVNRKSGQVSRYFYVNGKRRRHVVGQAAGDGMMHANDVFRLCYPEEWEAAFGGRGPGASMRRAGLYMAFLAIGWNLGLYPALAASLGASDANVLMDLALYLIRHRDGGMKDIREDIMEDIPDDVWKDCTRDFDEDSEEDLEEDLEEDFPEDFRKRMARQILFSRTSWTGLTIADVLSGCVEQDALDRFREAWLAKCTQKGRRAVWLHIEDFGARSRSKAGSSGSEPVSLDPFVCPIWAVDASNGTPISWFVNSGSKPDTSNPDCSTPDCSTSDRSTAVRSTAVRESLDGMLALLAGFPVDVKGVILDRTLATQDMLAAVQERGLEYIVMLEKNSPGHACMMERHGRELRNILAHGIDRNGIISSMVDRASLFPQGADESHVALFYSAQRRAMDESAILRPAIDALVEAKKNIALGRKVSLPRQVRDFISLKFDAAGKVVGVEPEQEKLDAKFKGSGYFAIASSAARTARQILDIHALKAPRKYRFASLESLSGIDSERAVDGKSMKARMIPGFAGFAGFVAAVLGNAFKNGCRESGLDPNRMLDALDEEVAFARMPNGDFLAGSSLSSSVGILLGNLGIRPDQVKQLALDLGVEERTPAADETRRLPLVEERRRRGRIKGSKNKKTLEREAREAELREQGLLPPKRRPGRPKSAKTLEREAREAELRERGELPERRGPGRPRGSRNRAALEREAQTKAGGEPAERLDPGRPKGGKNRTTLEREARMGRAARKNAQKRQKEAESALGTPSDTPADTPSGNA